jgi:nucleoside-diphosphate-sugar epimerase
MDHLTQDNVIVIGMGWLGSAFARSCRERGIRVEGTVRGDKRFERGDLQGIPIHPFSLGDPLPALLADTPPPKTAVVTISPGSSGLSPAAFEQGLRALGAALVSAGTHRVVYTSATSVYPIHIANPKEQDAADIYSPRSGISLYRAEESLSLGAKDAVVVILRFSGLFGPGRHPGRFFLNRPLRFPDDPINLIHLDDCIGVINLALTINQSIVVNASAPHHPERGVFYTAAALALGEMPPMSIGPARSTTPRIVNTDRLVKDLGYQFTHPDPLMFYL